MKLSESNDFAYLLELMPALHGVPEYTWLPELFSIIGAERFISLCKYAGGEYIKIPTQTELALSIKALQYYYDIEIKKEIKSIPPEIEPLYAEIKKSFNN